MELSVSEEVEVFNIGINYRRGQKFVITEEVAQDFLKRVNTDIVYGEMTFIPDNWTGKPPAGVRRFDIVNHFRVGVLLLPSTAVIREGKAYCQFQVAGQGQIHCSDLVKKDNFADYLSCRYSLKDKTDLVDKIITIDVAAKWTESMKQFNDSVGEEFDDCLTIFTNDPNDPLLKNEETQ